MEKIEVIKSIGKRTGGDIYLGVVGAVRTGKSTFIRKFMENLVIPNIEDEYERKRCLDELPQAAAGKTIMTTEPKFVPATAAKIKVEDFSANIRMIDCVGYVVKAAKGYEDENGPRLVMTPWYSEPIPFTEAAEIGTEKVIKEHSTIGIVVTTDGSIGDIPRSEYVEAVVRTRRWCYDVVSEMYPWHNRVHLVAEGKGALSKYYKAPYFLCEYAHAMGMGAGDLEPYVQDFYRGDNMLGGCIWEFCDHAAYHADGPVHYTYGGDHGENKHDSNFCTDGLFFPDRTPHAGAYQMKNAYRPVRATAVDENRYLFQSMLRFATLQIQVRWELLSDGISVVSGQADLTLNPLEMRELTFDFELTQRSSCHNVLLVRYLRGDEELGFEQFTLTAPTPLCTVPGVPAPMTQVSENKLWVYFDRGHLVFNGTTGQIEDYVVDGVPLLHPDPEGEIGPAVALYRAPLDNDMNLRRNWERLGLDRAGFYIKKPGTVAKMYMVTDNGVEITADYVLAGPRVPWLGSFRLTYTVYRTGKVRLDVLCLRPNRRLRHLPRYGVVMEMPSAFDQVRYYGMGPYPNLSDYNLHCHTGIFETAVATMHEDYIKPQESSARTDTRWAQVTDRQGFGLRFDAIDAPMIFAADPYTSQRCAKARHREELTAGGTTCIHLDQYQLGAGSNACGPVPRHGHTRNTPGNRVFSFSFEPTGERHD